RVALDRQRRVELVDAVSQLDEVAPQGTLGAAQGGPEPVAVLPDQRLPTPRRGLGPEAVRDRVGREPAAVRLKEVEQLPRRPPAPRRAPVPRWLTVDQHLRPAQQPDREL